MTICIAAIGTSEELDKNNEAIIFATDHMITLFEIGQFEHSIAKYRKINPTTIAMLSGEALLFEEILKDTSAISFDEIAEQIHKNMIEIRDERIKKVVFDKFQIDFDYLKEVLRNPEYNEFIDDILKFIKPFNLQTVLLLIGFENNNAQIIEINEEGKINTRDINFDAIGTGASQAINTLLFQRHTKTNNLKTTLYNVFKAKRNSEVAAGVGKETDIFLLLNDGKIYKFNDEHIEKLNDIYQKEMKFGKEHSGLDGIFKRIEEIDLNV